MGESRSPLLNGHAIDLPGRGRTWVYDSGPPAGEDHHGVLLLLHGWTSTAALNFFRCFKPLSKEFRVIALDQRGHGRGIRSSRPFRLEDCADDAAAMLETLGTGPTTAVGYSMGGPVAQLLWKQHPDAVSGLVLCATAMRFATRSQFSGAFGLLGTGVSLAVAGIPAPVRQQVSGMIVRNRLSGAGVAPWAVAEWERNDPAALLQAGMALGRFDSEPWIGSVDVPTAVVQTAIDDVVPPRSQLKLAKAIPGARTFTVHGDHRACVDQADQFVPALAAACRSVQGRR